jgi:hypothetical protein
MPIADSADSYKQQTNTPCFVLVALWANNKIPDERALGRYCTAVLRGKLDKTAHSKAPAVLPITLYAPIHSNGEKSAWAEQGKYSTADKHNI